MISLQPPSSALPPLKQLSTLSGSKVDSLVQLLRQIYEPDVIGTKKKEKAAVDSGYASEASDDDDGERPLDSIRDDKFERALGLKWLVGFIARAEEWIEEVDEEEEQVTRSKALEDASALLSACSGLATGPLMRTFEFARHNAEEPIVIHLRDASIVDTDHTSVGLQTWGSSCILAQRMAKAPSSFGLDETRPMRVLELGAGTGLMSMVLSKLLHPSSEIIATDFHEAVLSNLRTNVDRNFSAEGGHAPTIVPLDWRHLHSLASSDGRPDAPFDTPFDLIIGADIIYEPSHAVWVKSSVELLLRKGGHFYLIMPARPTHDAETASVPATFPLAADLLQDVDRESEIAILDVEEIDRIAGTGRTDSTLR